ncbi:MAG: metal-dependent transcriptional regulator [bacterium]|nr:MAG: metal-dependent transcriptional regulator [bacterium]
MHEVLDEILEVLWTRLEEGGEESVPRDRILIGAEPAGDDALSLLQEKGLIRITDGSVQLTDAGFEAARQTIRRHRLSERMFLDIFTVAEEEMEDAACRFEHMLIKPGLEEKICELLGHPRVCPHGRPVPVGECCHRAETLVDKAVAPLNNLRQGERGTIAYVHTGDSERLKKLMAMGILPGEQITLQRRYPSFVFDVGHSSYAVDEGMARAIFVRREGAAKGQASSEQEG